MGLLAMLVVLAGCSVMVEQRGATTDITIMPSAVAYLQPRLLETRVHDATSYTQGLLLHNGFFYESGGLYGVSSLRKVDPKTGDVLKRIDVPQQYFAEGLALVGNRLIQLTWREQVAFIYDLETFDKVGEFTYEGEGWGLCYDGEVLYMSNGGESLTVRDPQSFAVVEVIPVRLFGEPVFQLNELECVGPHIYANIYQTDSIVKIEKHTGRVAGFIDASRLLIDALPQLTPEQVSLLDRRDVLNGISYDADTGNFYLTGKLWPMLLVVDFNAR
jgi:glutaminyl-peptide cyclotransferase